MKYEELTKTNRLLAEGIEVSNDTRKTGYNNNDLIIGSSGSGKTGGYVIPNIQRISGSLVVSDTKGRLYKMFKDELLEKGYKVHVIDFVNPDKSCGYNPIGEIRRYENGNYREQDVLTLANNIVPIMDKKEPFWEKAAAGYIAMLIAFCIETLDESEQNMISVCRLHQSFIKSNSGKIAFTQYFEKNPTTFAARKYNQMKASGAADKMWSSIMEFANRALEPFAFEEAKGIFGNENPIKLRDLGKEPIVLFLNVSDTDRTYDDLVNIFYTQALQVLCSEADANDDGRLDVPVRIIMDDFATSARIPDFDKVISVIRSREISVSLILQSLTQLESMYEHAEAMTIINNCDHLLYLGSQDQETAQFIGTRAYKTPESVLCMPRDKAILMTNGEKAKEVIKIRPYSSVAS